MRATVGDRICVNSPTVSQPPRLGTVLELRGGGRMRVAWDDGTESTYMPAAGAALVIPDVHTAADAQPDRFACDIAVSVEETGPDCAVTATMVTPRGSFRGDGQAHRHPDDPSVPMIGEELAISRALHALADELEQAAMEAIADHESRPIHLLQPS